jgi:hypothetical protein
MGNTHTHESTSKASPSPPAGRKVVDRIKQAATSSSSNSIPQGSVKDHVQKASKTGVLNLTKAGLKDIPDSVRSVRLRFGYFLFILVHYSLPHVYAMLMCRRIRLTSYRRLLGNLHS